MGCWERRHVTNNFYYHSANLSSRQMECSRVRVMRYWLWFRPHERIFCARDLVTLLNELSFLYNTYLSILW